MVWACPATHRYSSVLTLSGSLSLIMCILPFSHCMVCIRSAIRFLLLLSKLNIYLYYRYIESFMNPMPIADRHPLILPLDSSLGHWTDHAARTGKCGLPVGSACRPSVPEFPLTPVIRGRGRDPRIPSFVGHMRSEAGTIQAKFPPASVRRLGYDVVGTLTRFYEVGDPPFMHVLDRRG